MVHFLVQDIFILSPVGIVAVGTDSLVVQVRMGLDGKDICLVVAFKANLPARSLQEILIQGKVRTVTTKAFTSFNRSVQCFVFRCEIVMTLVA
jgi:hypothetical protein